MGDIDDKHDGTHNPARPKAHQQAPKILQEKPTKDKTKATLKLLGNPKQDKNSFQPFNPCPIIA